MISGIGNGMYDISSMMMGGMRGREPSSEELFAKADADGSGGITMEELKEAHAKKPKADGPAGPPAEEVFAQMDVDGDGVISQQEHAEGLEAMRQQLQRQADMNMMGRKPSPEELFGAADADGDGSLTMAELISAMGVDSESEEAEAIEEAFARMDTNGDGKVSQEEHAAAMEAMRQMMPPGGPMGAMAGNGGSEESEESEESYDELDTNQDGYVSESEWAAGVEKGLVMDNQLDPRVTQYGAYGENSGSTFSAAA